MDYLERERARFILSTTYKWILRYTEALICLSIRLKHRLSNESRFFTLVVSENKNNGSIGIALFELFAFFRQAVSYAHIGIFWPPFISNTI